MAEHISVNELPFHHVAKERNVEIWRRWQEFMRTMIFQFKISELNICGNRSTAFRYTKAKRSPKLQKEKD